MAECTCSNEIKQYGFIDCHLCEDSNIRKAISQLLPEEHREELLAILEEKRCNLTEEEDERFCKFLREVGIENLIHYDGKLLRHETYDFNYDSVMEERWRKVGVVTTILQGLLDDNLTKAAHC